MAITKFKAPDGGEYEGQVVWNDVGGKRNYQIRAGRCQRINQSYLREQLSW